MIALVDGKGKHTQKIHSQQPIEIIAAVGIDGDFEVGHLILAKA